MRNISDETLPESQGQGLGSVFPCWQFGDDDNKQYLPHSTTEKLDELMHMKCLEQCPAHRT